MYTWEEEGKTYNNIVSARSNGSNHNVRAMRQHVGGIKVYSKPEPEGRQQNRLTNKARKDKGKAKGGIRRPAPEKEEQCETHRTPSNGATPAACLA
jgi:hypothetical protein